MLLATRANRSNTEVQEDIMVTFDKSDFQRFAVSAVGALALTAASVVAAVGPAKAASYNAPLTVQDWQSRVERRIEGIREAGTVYQPQHVAVATIAVRFTADGDYAGTAVAKSSGDRLVDSRALSVARGIRYPALPEGYRGNPATVRMTLYFGDGAAEAEQADRQADRRNTQVAFIETDNGMTFAAR
jgi:TonB family protein